MANLSLKPGTLRKAKYLIEKEDYANLTVLVTELIRKEYEHRFPNDPLGVLHEIPPVSSVAEAEKKIVAAIQAEASKSKRRAKKPERP